MDRVVGFHPVREALRARRRRLRRLRIREALAHPGLPELRALAAAADLPVESVPAATLHAGLPPELRTQGIVLEAGPLPSPSLDELANSVLSGAPPRGGRAARLVLLDGVEDPQNVGAVVRVAEVSGAAGLLLGARRSPPLEGALARASAGAVEHLPVCRVPNLARGLDGLRERGFWILGADAEGPEALFDSPDRLWDGPLVLVFGAEGRGIRPGVAARLDHRLRIPVAGQVASLNVASAAAVVLFEVLRRRQAAATPGEGAATRPASARK